MGIVGGQEIDPSSVPQDLDWAPGMEATVAPLRADPRAMRACDSARRPIQCRLYAVFLFVGQQLSPRHDAEIQSKQVSTPRRLRPWKCEFPEHAKRNKPPFPRGDPSTMEVYVRRKPGAGIPMESYLMDRSRVGIALL